jgi:hypothetical protein
MGRELDDDDVEGDLELPPFDDAVDDDAPGYDGGAPPSPRPAGHDGPAGGDVPDAALEVDDAGGLDDAVAADLDVGVELDDHLEGQLVEDRDEDVDVGALDDGIDVEDERSEAGDDAEGGADTEGIGFDETFEGDDGGAEGTSENPEDEIDEAALPDMDDGEDTSGDDALAEALLAESEGSLPPWASSRVILVEGAGAAVPCRSVVAAAGRVAAAGEVLLLVEEGARAARRLPFGEGALAVALGEEGLVAATARGQLLVSHDFGATASSLGACRTGAVALSLELATTPGRFWVREGGALSCGTLPAQPPFPVRDRGVLAIAASGGMLLALTLAAGVPGIERFRGDDEDQRQAPLPEPARGLVERAKGGVLLAASAKGRCLAIGDGLRVALSRDGGVTFALSDPGRVIALAFGGEGADATLLGLLAPEGSASASLVAWGAAGDATRIGEVALVDRDTLGAARSAHADQVEAKATMAWDAARELVWVASAAGLVALGWPQRH